MVDSEDPLEPFPAAWQHSFDAELLSEWLHQKWTNDGTTFQRTPYLPHIPLTRMSANTGIAGSTPVSDNDRLIAALQRCFYDLIDKQDEQTDRLHRAIEALKPQAPVSDKNTFWNFYMKLADEHDKDFHKKYSTGLDSALIFSTPPILVLVAKGMLYISLFITLRAALLAVLGKQWLMYYRTVGSGRTIEERGLERQRKLDGLRRWKFEAVLPNVPRPSAPRPTLVLLRALGIFMDYRSLNSNYRPSHDTFRLDRESLIAWICCDITRFPVSNTAYTFPRRFHFEISAYFERPDLIPVVPPCPARGPQLRPTAIHADSCEVDLYSAHEFSEPSAVVPAVLWVLETSIDPEVVEAAAEVAVQLQLPLDLDLTTQMTRLMET
ncbi:hypothetical protein B0H13DRAFT_2339064 [Mycena leptocephala]|nr:hypothetical protein B0H13DRAFT_2339064 [Mycena leptocephala]